MNALSKLVLKGSALSAFALALAAGCSSDDSKSETTGAAGESPSKGGSSSTAGKTGSDAGESNGGKGEGGGDSGVEAGHPGVGLGGGAPAEGGAGGAADAGGAGGAGGAPAVAKFCNTLQFGTADTTMILEVGTGAEKVTFTAMTGECVPADGDACVPIPSGAHVPLALFDADNTDAALDEKEAEVVSGDNWIFITNLDESGSEPTPIIDGGALKATAGTCEEFTYADATNN